MTTEEREEYVKYRIKSAHQAFDAAKILAKNGYWNSVVNRLYYALFYAVNALLVAHEIQTKTHSGTKGRFSLHFVKTGKFDKIYGQLFSELFDWRQKSDYDTFIDFNNEFVEPLFEPVAAMIDLIEKEIKKKL